MLLCGSHEVVFLCGRGSIKVAWVGVGKRIKRAQLPFQCGFY